jgi:hypothetical protein
MYLATKQGLRIDQLFALILERPTSPQEMLGEKLVSIIATFASVPKAKGKGLEE